MEEVNRAKYVGRDAELPGPLQAVHSEHLYKSPTWKFLNLSFGFLWRLPYIGMID